MTWLWPDGHPEAPNLKPGGGSDPNAANSEPNVNGLVVSSEFHDADHATAHQGIDLIIPDGMNRASAVGTVFLADNSNWVDGYGILVEVHHDDQSMTRYGHNAAGSLRVSPGDRVSPGQVVGTVGKTGDATGEHCHYETHETIDGPAVNPRDYMAARTGSAPRRPPVITIEKDANSATWWAISLLTGKREAITDQNIVVLLQRVIDARADTSKGGGDHIILGSEIDAVLPIIQRLHAPLLAPANLIVAGAATSDGAFTATVKSA